MGGLFADTEDGFFEAFDATGNAVGLGSDGLNELLESVVHALESRVRPLLECFYTLVGLLEAVKCWLESDIAQNRCVMTGGSCQYKGVPDRVLIDEPTPQMEEHADTIEQAARAQQGNGR